MKIASFGAAVALGLSVALPASAAPDSSLSQETRVLVDQSALTVSQGHVVAHDMQARTMTVQTQRGESIQLPLLFDTNGAPMREGDVIELAWRDATGVEITKAARPDYTQARFDTDTIVRVGAGYNLSRTQDIEARIQSIDTKAHKLKLRGARAPGTLDVGTDVDVAALKPGDSVHIVTVKQYRVQPAGKA